ncbi:MAG: translation initiation factor IF-3 [Dehalococcoidia bacterium]|nr:translation initiation factor IF-3 [Dehalococcoidia bacterium]
MSIIKKLHVNRDIRAKEVLVIGGDGERFGVMPLNKALDMASSEGLDLVEVGSNASPPVCRILDYGKYKYQQAKREREARKTHKPGLIREVRLRIKIGEHDLQFKIRMIKKFLDEGDRVKVSVIFRGREITHPDIGWQLLQKVLDALKDDAKVDRKAVMEGRNMNVILSNSAKRNTKTETLKESINAKAKDS